jgi:hypothetical protein
VISPPNNPPTSPDGLDDFDDHECWNCGGEGFIADCFDGFCINAEDGCDLCMRRCEYCKPLKARAASQ